MNKMEPQKKSEADICPLCEELGRTSELFLKQINAMESLYVCNNSKCPYPVGVSTETVYRPVKELLDQSEEKELESQTISAGEDDPSVISEVPVIQFDSELSELLLNFLDNQT